MSEEVKAQSGMGHALSGESCSAIEHKKLREENERLKAAKDDAERSRDDAIGRCVAAQEQVRVLEEKLDQAYAWIANPDSPETSEEILAALRSGNNEPAAEPS